MAGSMSPAWRPGRRPAAAALVAVAMVLLVGCDAPAAPTGPTPTTTLGPATASAPTPTASPVPTVVVAATVVPTTVVATTPPATAPPITAPPSIAPPPTPAPAVGVALRIGDQQLMTVLAAEEWAGAPGVRPAKGKAFFTVSIRIDAVGITSWDSANFRVRDADRGYSWRTGRSPHLYDGANMTAGNYYIGWITYEVPKASLDELTLVYRPAFLDDATFRVPLFD